MAQIDRRAQRDRAADADVYATQMFEIAKALPEYQQMFQITGVPTVNQGIGGVLFKPWDERTRSAHELQQDLQQKWNEHRRRARWRHSSSRRCRAHRACRCSS